MDWYWFIFGFWSSFFQIIVLKLDSLCLKTYKLIYYTCFMLSSKNDMHKRKFSILMASILDFFNLNMLSVQKKIGSWHPNFFPSL